MIHRSILRSVRRRLPVVLAILTSSLLAGTVGSAELLMNGTFDNQLHPWKTNPAHGNWNPQATAPGEVNLHPDRPGQRGDVVYQNLNVTGVAGASVSATVQLRANYSPAGRGIAVYLEYIDSGDIRQRVQVLNPDNSAITNTFTTFSNSVTLPTDAVRLVKFSAAKVGDGAFFGDNFSLQADGLMVNPVPTVHQVEPNCGPYGTVTKLTGSGFGNTAGVVLFGDVPGAVQSWTDTNIMARVDAPAVTGRVTIFHDNQVENHGVSPFHVTSPYITGHPVRAHQRVIKGEVAEYVVSIEFRNGFVSASGVNLSIPQLGTGPIFSPRPLKDSGGGVLTIPTANLNTGLHHWMVRADDGVHPHLEFPISLEVVTITNITFTGRDPATFAEVPLPNPYTVTQQGNLVIGASFTDHMGGKFGDFEASFTAVSSNPGAVVQYRDNFDSLNTVAVGNGTSVLTYTTPDGFSNNLTVQVNYPAADAVTSIGLGMSSTDNAGKITNTFNAAANGTLTSIGLPSVASNYNGTFFNGSMNYSSEFLVFPGSSPGVYPFSADTIGARSVALLTVTNAGNRGEIRGNIHTLNGAFFHGPVGNMVFHDASSGAPVFTNMLELGFTGNSYRLSFLPPGDYRIKLEVDPFLPFQSSQWYPNASNFADAQTVNVTAGDISPGVDFFLNGPVNVSLPEALEFCPSDLFSSGHNNRMWTGQQLISHDGQDAGQSPTLANDQLSFIETTVVGPGTLSFWWKVSSEANADILRLEMNFNAITNISGEVDWTHVTVPVPDGPTTVSWTYQKNNENAVGMDAAWLDQVMFSTASGAPPVITQQPQNQSVQAGANAMFNVIASGAGLGYQWQKNSSDLTGQNGMALNLNNVQAGDAGMYRVIVSNSHGSVTSAPANLTITFPPTIDTHPMSQTLGLDGNTMLTVAVSGTGPFTYQWKQDGTVISGATDPSLNLSMLSPAAAGRYSVTVTGPGGSVTSQTATLTLIDLDMYAGITIFGRVGDQFRIEYANDLNSQTWTAAETITLPSSPFFWFDIHSPNQPMRYYRAILLPQP